MTRRFNRMDRRNKNIPSPYKLKTLLFPNVRTGASRVFTGAPRACSQPTQFKNISDDPPRQQLVRSGVEAIVTAPSLLLSSSHASGEADAETLHHRSFDRRVIADACRDGCGARRPATLPRAFLEGLIDAG